MRHKSLPLTTVTYTDSDKVPVAAALAKMPEFGLAKEANHRTEKDTGFLVHGSQPVSQAVTTAQEINGDKTIENKGESHCLSLAVAASHQQANGGERGIRTPDTFWVFTLSRRAR